MLPEGKWQNLYDDVVDWSKEKYGPSPPIVKSTYRFMGTLRWLGLIQTETLVTSTKKDKVAKLVIKRIMERCHEQA